MDGEEAPRRGIAEEVEGVLNEAADNVDGTIALLEDVRGARATRACTPRSPRSGARARSSSPRSAK